MGKLWLARNTDDHRRNFVAITHDGHTLSLDPGEEALLVEEPPETLHLDVRPWDGESLDPLPSLKGKPRRTTFDEPTPASDDAPTPADDADG